ncbi:hypothetical protein PVT68_04475 [Microbulbifer bruguierae]|uniref:Bacteriocin n=1 Tax=Microbulbifer bruguierae TaxID=3029061 RepID=A0ABY8NF43_9GAMM|nr:hypothetical protein [Microbulbifer bruguierae]WGL17550.1 hypothetical protein PVT68_04475 [Microbulbifer bruguierae]
MKSKIRELQEHELSSVSGGNAWVVAKETAKAIWGAIAVEGAKQGVNQIGQQTQSGYHNGFYGTYGSYGLRTHYGSGW